MEGHLTNFNNLETYLQSVYNIEELSASHFDNKEKFTAEAESLG